LTELEKEVITRKARFSQLGRAFHAPKEREVYLGKQEAAKGAAQENRVSSAMSSVKGSANNDKKSIDAEAAEGQQQIPPYDPLVPEQWLDRCKEFKTLHLIKFPRIWQTLAYLLKFQTQADLCKRDTNKLSWKKTKALICNDGAESIFRRLGDYWPFGPKEDEYTEYQKLAFVRENLEGSNEEAIAEYSAAMAKLYAWIVHATELRINDVVGRRQ